MNKLQSGDGVFWFCCVLRTFRLMMRMSPDNSRKKTVVEPAGRRDGARRSDGSPDRKCDAVLDHFLQHVQNLEPDQLKEQHHQQTQA